MSIVLRALAATLPLLAVAGPAVAFEISSSAVSDGQWDKKYIGGKIVGCEGQNTSPPLTWKDLPDGTKSLALTLYDPDALTGSGLWHWQVWNIPVSIAGFEEGKVPRGAVEGTGDLQRRGYIGPCPRPGSGVHHYTFTLYAIKVPTLKIPRGATRALVGYNLNTNAIAKATVRYSYQR
jgi:Raf kinase inhibitor-like YbhB/YbcL family protein